MSDSDHKIYLLIAEVAALPQWAVVSGACFALAVGVAIGWAFWRQFKAHGSSIELETRRAQSEFDLVSRDVFKAKQEASALMASRNQKIG